MSSDSADAMMSDLDLDNWSDDDSEDEALSLAQYIDSRRQVENKLDELRLAKEISEYNFDF